jgi:aliphatic nitrilase
VVNATGWLSEAQIASITPDAGLQKALRGGCCTAIVSPEGVLLAEPLRQGEGLVVADLDMALIAKRKRMMDSVGHYARPELLSLVIDDRPARTVTAWSDTHEPARHHFASDRPLAEQQAADDGAAKLRLATG